MLLLAGAIAALVSTAAAVGSSGAPGSYAVPLSRHHALAVPSSIKTLAKNGSDFPTQAAQAICRCL
jgi:hypothetical protein